MTTKDDVTQAIQDHDLRDWFEDYPWLTSCLGDSSSPVWFIGENPSLLRVTAQLQVQIKDDNLQWNSSKGDQLFRQAIVDAGLKDGRPEAPGGWRCYITNAIKAPEIVAERNAKKRRAQYWKGQADIWRPVLQRQIDEGRPRVLVALGSQVLMILKYMMRCGLNAPPVEKINHYSYIMFRPEYGTGRGPGHKDRIIEFKLSIGELARRYAA